MYCGYIFYFYLLLLFEWMLICIFLLSDSCLKLYKKNVINIELCGIKSIFMLCVIFYISFLMYIRNGDWFEIIIWKI